MKFPHYDKWTIYCQHPLIAGNMFTKQESDGTLTQFTYDPENRLTKVVKDSATIAEYTYDGDGGRTSKKVSGITTTFVGSLYEETLAKGTKSIFLGSTRIASVVNGKVLYYHGDHLGGTNVVTDDVGDVNEIIEYMPYGKESRRDKFYSDPEEQARYTFSNHYKDDETGLIFMQARYYDPSLGRFITADPTVQNPSNPVTFNRYHYAGNNPVNNIDPSGYGFFSKLFKAFKNSIGSFIGGIIGSTIGAFAGAIVGNLPGAIIGAYVGGTVGAGIGQTIQHGGSLGSNIKNAFIGSLPAVLGAGVGFAIGGPSGALAGAIGGGVAGSVVTTLANGGSLEDGVISGIVTTSYAVISLGYYKAIGSKVIQKGVDINNARRAGVVQPIGQNNNTNKSSLDIDKGTRAGQQQTQNASYEYQKTQVTRYVGEGEAAIINGKGFIPNVDRFGNSKNVFFTFDEPLNSASAAQKAYQLPNRPTHRATFTVEKARILYGGNVKNGTGTEVITRQEIIRNSFEVQRLNN